MQIKVLATNYLINGGEELHIYTVDENNRVLENDSIIAEIRIRQGLTSVYLKMIPIMLK